MTQKEKELLLKDLCARLPYGVICDCSHDYHTKASAIDTEDLTVYYPYCDEWESIEYCKPYLRPMSSMTEEQKKEFDQLLELELKAINDEIDPVQTTIFEVDFYNKNHVDYRGLIKKGLAIDCTNLNIY